MMNKWILMLALAGVPIASAKSYDLTIATPSVVHNVKLNPGDYRLKLDGSNAIFTDANGHHYTAAVSVKQEKKKFDETEVDTTKVAGQDRINEIRLSGTRMALEFN
jgi:hypothetical protein